ncbi:myozenin-3 isoform X2 [Perognathus longimembris pacificus]|uniref:myozenin-3 isoform X2 n=1 Tax=Perognathus longimembris pacificus TaxID=214514 RepID=UPI00201953CF|nr:myozenin-3 isoform X2 [Perognathus longimembris pacificus]
MISKEQKQPTTAVMGSLAGPVPSLDLGKKLSVPQDLMLEELSLRNNRGSLLFQKRHRRVQRFTFEFEASQPGTEARSPRGEVTGAAAPGTATRSRSRPSRRKSSTTPPSPRATAAPGRSWPAPASSAATSRPASPTSAISTGLPCHLEEPWTGRPFTGKAPPLSQSPLVAWNSCASDPTSTGWLRAGSASSQSLRSCRRSL